MSIAAAQPRGRMVHRRDAATKAPRQGIHGDSRQGSCSARLVRQTAPGYDLVAGGASDRAFPRHRAAHSAHAGRARLCRAERTRVLAVLRHSQARLCLFGDTELDRAGDAADAAAERAVPRVVFGGDPGRNRDRLRRAFPGTAHHVGDACGRNAAAGILHVAGKDPARLSRRGGALAAVEVIVHRGLHAVDDHRRAGAVRTGARGPGAGIFHRRRRARTRPALDRGAGP